VRTTVARTSSELPVSTQDGSSKVVEKKLNFIQTILHIIKTDGFAAFFNGLGPALILVSNPILQFTVCRATYHGAAIPADTTRAS
jgi:adenine nucleotide transporter 17